MSARWPVCKLGDVIRHRKEFIQINDLSVYKRCRVQLHAQGIVLRDTVPGAEIKTKKQQVCHAGEFLVAEIDAKVGGFGIVPSELESAIVSSHYFLFVVDTDRLDRKFLDFFIRTPQFRGQVAAQGSTNYAAIRPGEVLEYAIPLPPLTEQRRIVARIEELAAKIEEANGLRRDAVAECDSLCRSIIADTRQGAAIPTPMSELVSLREQDVVVRQDETYNFAGVYCFGRGVFRGPTKTGMEFSYKTLTRIKAGDFVYPKLMAWEGAFGIVPSECDGLTVSPEFPVFSVHQERVRPEVLDVYFRNPNVWPQVAGKSTGTNVRRRRLNPGDFLSYVFPLPPTPVQNQLVDTKSRLDALKKLQSETAVELDALLPSVLDKAFKGKL